MVNEIYSQCGLRKRTLMKAQRRWRLAYFSVYFSNFMLSIVKVPKKLINGPISRIVATPSYTALEITFDDKSGGFSSIDEDELVDMIKMKDMKILQKFNGVEGLARYHHTTLEYGISRNDIERRKNAFGSNICNTTLQKGFLYFLAKAFKDTTIITMLACGARSLGFGIKVKGATKGWYEGGSIFMTTFLVMVIFAASNFRRERKLNSMSKVNNNIKIDVMREGVRLNIPACDVVVGDVIILKRGDQIPADGILIHEHSLFLDESNITGEGDHIHVDSKTHPFLLFGSKVVDGHAQMLVISVGINTAWWKMIISDEKTSLQYCLKKLTYIIAMADLAISVLNLANKSICYFTRPT